jgi:hypothetical protein
VERAGMPDAVDPYKGRVLPSALEETHLRFPPFLCCWASTQATTWFEKNVSRLLGLDRTAGVHPLGTAAPAVRTERPIRRATSRIESGVPRGLSDPG